MVKRYGLRDDQWACIEDLLPGRDGTVGVSARDNRLFVEAVLYRYRTGVSWRDLPERFGHW
jgi:transposase